MSVALTCSNLSGNVPVAVLAEDTDILTLLLHHVKPKSNKVFLVLPLGRGEGAKRVVVKLLIFTHCSRKSELKHVNDYWLFTL